MYLVIGGKPNGDVTYYGPFPNEDRAKEYGTALAPNIRWHVTALVVPNCIKLDVSVKY